MASSLRCSRFYYFFFLVLFFFFFVCLFPVRTSPPTSNSFSFTPRRRAFTGIWIRCGHLLFFFFFFCMVGKTVFFFFCLFVCVRVRHLHLSAPRLTIKCANHLFLPFFFCATTSSFFKRRKEKNTPDYIDLPFFFPPFCLLHYSLKNTPRVI